MAHVGVIGGGIAGLMAAYRCRKQGASVTLLEASERVGGVIQSTTEDRFLVEHGPNSLRPTDLLERVVAELDLSGERVWADATASTRYVVRDGQPVALPTSFGSFLSTDLFSTRAKLRLLVEPFIGSPSADAAEESLADFTRRRLGREVLDYAVAPFVGGVFAGRPDALSARHAFERLVELEREHGSLFWGAVQSDRDNPAPDDAPSALFSFRNGLETLPAAFAEVLGECIVREAPVTGLHRDEEKWVAEVNAPTDVDSPFHFDAVICTVPLHALAALDIDTGANQSPLHDVTYPPVHVVALGYDRDAVDHPLDGFGLLVPPVEDDFDVLGTIFSSTLFPGRAPDDAALLTTFVGGARNPALAGRPASAIQSIVERDLTRLLGVDSSPRFAKHIHWPQAIPQYTLGYGAVKDALRTLEANNDGLFFAGNYRQGVSVGDAMASGASAADRASVRGSA